VRLQLHALAYNLATFLRCIELPEAMADWSLASLQRKLIHCLSGDACITEKEDRGPRGVSRPRHHLPTRRGCRHRPNGTCHPCRHPSITGAAFMRVTSKLAKAERTRQDSSVRHASKRGRISKVTGIRGSIRPHSSPLTTAAEAERVNHLIWQQNQASLTPSGGPLGECRLI
jgi:hypothetical protein